MCIQFSKQYVFIYVIESFFRQENYLSIILCWCEHDGGMKTWMGGWMVDGLCRIPNLKLYKHVCKVILGLLILGFLILKFIFASNSMFHDYFLIYKKNIHSPSSRNIPFSGRVIIVKTFMQLLFYDLLSTISNEKSAI